MITDHMVKSFDTELRRLNATIARMGGLAEAQLDAAIRSVAERDSAAAVAVIAGDANVDACQFDVEDLAVKIMALRHPVAVDLRSVLSAMRIASDLERVGDYGASIAKRALVLNQAAPLRETEAISAMGRVAGEMVRDVIAAYVAGDAAKALAVWKRDEELDEMYSSLFRVLLTHMMEDPRHITPATHLLFVAKTIERVGDRSTNIAEMVSFLVTGATPAEMRPKRDVSSFENA
jgi:phosphate transport system protein